MTIEKVIEYFENFYAFEHNKELLLKIDNVLYPIQIKEENRAVVAIYNEKLDKKYKKILKQNKYLKECIEKMKCCVNCKHALQGEYDDFENCNCCHAADVECSIKSPTKNSSGKYHDWDDKCDIWELKV